MNTMRVSQRSYILFALALGQGIWGCGMPVTPTPSGGATGACATTVPKNGAPDLVEQGVALRDAALRAQFMPNTEGTLREASQCFERALTYAPENYDAVLGSGLTYLALARATDALRSSRAKQLLILAKRQLGRAYLLRQGSREALYYLAEAAMLEENSEEALRFLAPLEKSGYRLGPVNAMLGDAAFLKGDKETANTYWTAAANSGYPAETVEYAHHRVKGMPR